MSLRQTRTKGGWIWLLAAAAALTAACSGADDDDSNPTDDDSDDQDDDTNIADDDDQDFGSPSEDLLDFCTQYIATCLYLDLETAGEYCQTNCLDMEEDCSAGATLRLFQCTGSDCGKWEQCKKTWDEEIFCK